MLAIKSRLARAACFAMVAALGVVGSPAAQAQDKYPSRAVRIVVPSSAGGGTDTVARLFSQFFSEKLGGQFVVENRPGAGSMIGSESVARATPDGYTLLAAASTLTSLHVARKAMRYDAVRDFDPVTMFVALPNVIVVHSSSPVKSLQDLIALAKKQPGDLSYATPGIASNSHMSMEMLSAKAGIKLLHVPYNGVAPALTDVLAGRVPLMLVNLASAKPHIDSGAFRALAVTTAERSKVLPNIPTVKEAGVQDFESYQWFGLLAPKGTPAQVVSELHRASVEALKTDKIQHWVETEAGVVVGSSPARFRKQIADDVERWSAVAKAAGIAQH